MTANRYLGRMTPRQKLGAQPVSAGKWWTASHTERDLGLNVEGPLWRIHDFGQTAVLVRGCVVSRRDGQLLVPYQAAQLIHDHYERHDALPVQVLDGSFTIALLDARRGWVLLYRNLVGNGFTYYTETDGAFWFGSNVADLVEACGGAARPNTEALPAFFLFRFVPGR